VNRRRRHDSVGDAGTADPGLCAGGPESTEAAARARLGIPPDAERVLIVGESTHWDPNWLATSEGYWRWRVRRTLDRAVDELLADERRVFGVECIFFLRMYWERSPHRRDALRELVNSSRLRLSGSGVTTPDTILPRTESLMRDFLVGQEWLRANGMTQEPRLAYFPDCFGHSPSLPTLLKALGCDRAAITRIDGMFFPGCDWEPPSRFPRPGSSAETLTGLRASDFVWRDEAGSEVLCHWNSFGYGQGELLAHTGITRVMGLPFAVAARGEAHVARRIDRYAADLAKVSPTPYLFCPVGYDFSMPLHGLVGLLDRYNQSRFGDTGTWAVCAGLDDHLSLVEYRRRDLSTVELDPNPYWTGFYTARPSLKRAAFELADDLCLADALGVAMGDGDVPEELSGAWYTLCVSNHHDWVTGTSPDRVVAREQRPWLDRAAAGTSRVLTRLALRVPPPHEEPPSPPPSWHSGDDGTVVVDADGIAFTVDPGRGGTLSAAESGGTRVLAPGSFDVVAWEDEGGLWRMGHEFAGGRLGELASGQRRRVELDVAEVGAELRIATSLELDSARVRRELVFVRSMPGVLCRTEAVVARRHLLTVRLGFDPGEVFEMDCPGGQVRRPLHRWYRPTFWPLHSWVSTGRVSVLSERPAAVAATGERSVDVVVGRNATHERAWRFLPIPGMPAPGHDDALQTCEIALMLDGGVAAAAERPWPRDPARRHLEAIARRAVTVEAGEHVEVLAVKAAHRGDGIVVRLASRCPWGHEVRLTLPQGVVSARLCDARERDLAVLPVVDGAAVVAVGTPITTVRLSS